VTQALYGNGPEMNPDADSTVRHLQAVPQLAVTDENYFPATQEEVRAIEFTAARSIDLKALEILGSLGLDRNFRLLDAWVRFPTTSQDKFLELQTNPDTPNRAIRLNQAAQYIAKLRFNSILESDSLPYTEETLMLPHQPYTKLYRHFRSLAQRQPSERVPQRQLHTAKISITADRVYRSIHNPQPYDKAHASAAEAALKGAFVPPQRHVPRGNPMIKKGLSN
jgi:hypothetical protein